MRLVPDRVLDERHLPLPRTMWQQVLPMAAETAGALDALEANRRQLAMRKTAVLDSLPALRVADHCSCEQGSDAWPARMFLPGLCNSAISKR